MTHPDAERRVAVVTGSSSGIGAATARRLAADGFCIVLHAARNRAGAEDMARELSHVVGCQICVLPCDFSDTAVLPQFVDDCFKWMGRVDVWVNNAGADVLTGDSGREPFEQKLKRVLTVDVAGTLILSRLAGQRMRSEVPGVRSGDTGLIVNIGWDQADQGMAGDSGQMFAASKGAVMSATRSLAQSLAPQVRVNCIAPGWIQTAWGQNASESWQRRAVTESLLERWGQPEDVAGVVSFLAGSDGQFVNGQVIPVNGGFRYGSRSAP